MQNFRMRRSLKMVLIWNCGRTRDVYKRQEEKEKAEFEENNQMLTKEQKFVGSISGLMNPLTYIIVNVDMPVEERVIIW